jgi:hypothetical protein
VALLELVASSELLWQAPEEPSAALEWWRSVSVRQSAMLAAGRLMAATLMAATRLHLAPGIPVALSLACSHQ